jgi:hypothetical protein
MNSGNDSAFYQPCREKGDGKMRPSMKLLPYVILALMFLQGCGDSGMEFTEVKRLEEKVTERELRQYLRIVKALPDGKLPDIPRVFVPLPRWNPSRTLPVNDLIAEEQTLLDERWSVEWVSKHLNRNRALQRVLRRENLTVEQFVGLTLSLSASLARSTIRKDQNLDQIIRDGTVVIRQLITNDQSYSRLAPSVKHSILRQSGQLTRIDRAQRLNRVPPENVALVKSHLEELTKIFPKYLIENPIDNIVDTFDVQGLPFEEMAASGYDAEISWDPNSEDAIIGVDTPGEMTFSPNPEPKKLGKPKSKTTP